MSELGDYFGVSTPELPPFDLVEMYASRAAMAGWALERDALCIRRMYGRISDPIHWDERRTVAYRLMVRARNTRT